MDSKRNKHILLDVKQQPLNENYETQKHQTQETSDALSVIYIMEVTLYRKNMLTITRVSSSPFSRMYTLRGFIAKEHPIGDPLDPFEAKTINAQIEDRFNQLDYPTQVSASVCGSAAFFYCLQIDRPDVYRLAARELWSYGKTRIDDHNAEIIFMGNSG
jgi:hypothetical protein